VYGFSGGDLECVRQRTQGTKWRNVYVCLTFKWKRLGSAGKVIRLCDRPLSSLSFFANIKQGRILRGSTLNVPCWKDMDNRCFDLIPTRSTLCSLKPKSDWMPTHRAATSDSTSRKTCGGQWGRLLPYLGWEGGGGGKLGRLNSGIAATDWETSAGGREETEKDPPPLEE